MSTLVLQSDLLSKHTFQSVNLHVSLKICLLIDSMNECRNVQLFEVCLVIIRKRLRLLYCSATSWTGWRLACGTITIVTRLALYIGDSHSRMGSNMAEQSKCAVLATGVLAAATVIPILSIRYLFR